MARWAIRHLPLRDAYRKAVTLFEGRPDSWRAYRAVRGLFPEEQIVSLLPFLRERATGATHDGSDPPPALRIGAEPPTSWARSIAWYELRAYMLNQLLRDTDVMSMAHSLEVRCPFLDHVLAESVLGLPDSWVRSGRPKQLLVEALEGRLPARIVDRPKRGFMFPMAAWIAGAWKGRVEEVLFSGDASDAWLDRRCVARLWDGFQAGRVPWGRIWAVVVLKLWIHEHHIKE